MTLFTWQSLKCEFSNSQPISQLDQRQLTSMVEIYNSNNKLITDFSQFGYLALYKDFCTSKIQKYVFKLKKNMNNQIKKNDSITFF